MSDITIGSPAADAAISYRTLSLRWVLPFIVGLVGLFLATWPMFTSGFTLSPGDPGDARLVNYLLENTWGYLGRNPAHKHFWAPGFFYPSANTLAYSELMWSFGPFYWPWRLVGLPPDDAAQAWLLTILITNYIAAFVFLRLGPRVGPVGATFGAYPIAYGVSRLHHINHPQLLPWVYVLGCCLAAWRYFATLAEEREGSNVWQRRAWLTGYFLCLIAQCYGSFNVGFFVGLVTLIGVTWSLILTRSRVVVIKALRKDWGFLIWVAMGAGLLLWPLAWHYSETRRLFGPRPWEMVRTLLPTPLAWLRVSFLSHWYTKIYSIHALGMFRDVRVQAGIGLFTTCAISAGLLLARRRLSVQLMLLTSVTAMLLATCFYDRWSLWYFVYTYIPAADAVRAVYRIGMFLVIPAGIGLALLMDSVRKPMVFMAVLLVAVACCAEQLTDILTYDKYRQRDHVQAVASRVDTGKTAFVLSTGNASALGPEGDKWAYFFTICSHLDAMMASSLAGVPTINGYSGNCRPDWYELFFDNRTGTPDRHGRFHESIDRWAKGNGKSAQGIQWIEVDNYGP
jgi:hypothetical protein